MNHSKKINLSLLAMTTISLSFLGFVSCSEQKNEYTNLSTRGSNITISDLTWYVLKTPKIEKIDKDKTYHLRVDTNDIDDSFWTSTPFPLGANIWSFTILDSDNKIVQWQYQEATNMSWTYNTADRKRETVKPSMGHGWNFDNDNNWVYGILPLWKDNILDVDLKIGEDIENCSFAFLFNSN